MGMVMFNSYIARTRDDYFKDLQETLRKYDYPLAPTRKHLFRYQRKALKSIKRQLKYLGLYDRYHKEFSHLKITAFAELMVMQNMMGVLDGKA